MARTESRLSRRRSATSRASTEDTQAPTGGGFQTPSGEDLTVVGVDSSNLENNPDRYFGEVFKGAHFRKLNVPDQVAAGNDIVVTGVVHFDAPSVVITTRGMRVRADGPGVQAETIDRYTNIQHCNSRSFMLRIPAPEEPGQTVTFSVNGESTTISGGWRTDETRGPFRVDVVSSTTAAASSAVGYIPYAAAGGAAGYIADQFSGGPTNKRLIAAGAGLGAASKLALPRLSTVDIDFPTTEIAVLGGSAAALAILLQTSGAGAILGGAGEVAGAGLGAAADTVRGASGRE